jgi:tetratricopeptide (TPR) repeat protein
MVLVLDGAGSISEDLVRCLQAWLERSQVRLIMVGAQKPGLPTEQLIEIEGLPTPDVACNSDEVLLSPSVRLFLEVARRAGVQIDERSEGPRLGRICRHLEGLPLAIELAASRLTVLTLPQLEQRLEHRFDVLRSVRGGTTGRTLWASIEASFDTLSSPEQELLLEVSSLPGGFDLEMAEAIVSVNGDGSPERPAAIDLVQSLRERSLLRTSDSDSGRRFTMLRTIREFATEMRERSHAKQYAQQHKIADYLASLLCSWHRRLTTAERPRALAWFQREHENLAVVREYARRNDSVLFGELTLYCDVFLAESASSRQRLDALEDANTLVASGLLKLQLAARIAQVWQVLGHMERSCEVAQEAIAAVECLAETSPGDRHSLTADLLLTIASAERQAGKFAQSQERLVRVAELGQICGRPDVQSEVAIQAGLIERAQGQWDAAIAHFDQAAYVARHSGHEATAATAIRYRCNLLVRLGRHPQAQRDLLQLLEIAHVLCNRRLLHLTLTSLGMVAAELGNYLQSIEYYAEALRIAEQLGQRRAIATNRGNRGLAYLDMGEFALAQEELAAAELINRELEFVPGIALNLANRAIVIAALGRSVEARDLLCEALEIQEQLGNRDEVALLKAELARLYCCQDENQRAWMLLAEAIGAFDDLKLRNTVDGFLMLVTEMELLIAVGQASEARSRAADLVAMAKQLCLSTAHPRFRVRQACSSLGRFVGNPED